MCKGFSEKAQPAERLVPVIKTDEKDLLEPARRNLENVPGEGLP